MTAPAAAGRVLPTLNEDGSRRWIRPRPSHGRHWQQRRAVALLLIAIFVSIPYIEMAGKPLVLLDLPRREFTLFGTTFLPTDTILLMLLLVSIIITVFLLTALFGRVWCGWACPQTVYMEFLFRPIERWLEGGRSGSLALDRERGTFHPRRLLKYAIYLVLASFLAHIFLSYFVGVEQLRHWIFHSPAEHPTGFFIVTATTLAIFADFTYFREQTCLVACPYGRWQSVLLDRQSLIVAYDAGRGEPRAKGKVKSAGAGDCIDCGACVLTCPTGIDIRDGLQMECIHCTQCADACDAVMDKVGRPRGLIRYSSREALETRQRHLLRPRVVLYPAVLALFLGGFIYALSTRDAADITVLRGLGEPFVAQPDGRIANQVRVKIANRTGHDHAYRIDVTGAAEATVVAPQNPLLVPAGSTATTSVFIVLPSTSFHDGERRVAFSVSDGAGFTRRIDYRLVGPEHEDRHDRDGRDDRDQRRPDDHRSTTP
jgi:cytochrome c oxidase accessory protein FixG